MRDILFRGIWVHGNKEWIEGDLVRDSEGKPHIVDSKYAVYWGGESIFVCEDECEVIPETVGQYTGLLDKDGKKIFEGDILAFSDRLVYVHWHDYCGCWDCSYIKAIEGKPTLREDRSPDKWRYNAEVIGNIHDNKELFEVK